MDVVVVGAGAAGLAAASRLAAAGSRVVVHEARDRVGGRLLSVRDGDLTVELGATWFWPGEPLVHELVRRYALPVFPQSLSGDALFEPDGSGPRRVSGNPVDTPSSRLRAGAQSLAEHLAAGLPTGSLRLSDPVSRIEVADGGVVVHASTGTTRADHVVLALPPALAAEAVAFDPPLPDPVRQLSAGTAVWMGGVVKAVAVYDAPFWREHGLAGATISHLGPFREIHDHSGPDGTAGALFGFADATRFASSDAAAGAFRDQLVRLLGPAAAGPRAVHVADWSRDHRTSPRAPSPHASTRTYGHPLFQQPVHGRLHWACTETAPAYAGHVEGALTAGFQVADRLLRGEHD